MGPMRINNEMNRKKRLPTPAPQERAEAERDGHPGEMKARGAGKWRRDVFAVTKMSHPGAADFMVGPAEDMARMAADCGVTGVVAPATRPGRVKVIRDIVGELTIISPGVGTQGGSAGDTIQTGADYVIVGRSIYHSEGLM